MAPTSLRVLVSVAYYLMQMVAQNSSEIYGQRSDDLKPGNKCEEERQAFMNKVWLVTGSASGLGRNIAETRFL